MTTVERKLAQLLKDDNGSTDPDVESFEHFRIWFLQQFDKSLCDSCNLEDFAVYFLNAIRQQTEIHLRANESDTPKCQTPVRNSLMVAPASGANTSLTPKRLWLGQHNTSSMLAYPSTLDAHNDDSISLMKLDDSLCTSLDRSFAQSLQSNTSTSTPVRRTPTNQVHQRRSGHSFQTNTPSSGEKPQQRNSSASSSLCLGDFLVLNPSSRSNKKKTPQHVDNSSMPAGKPKKRVVPTTISNRQSASAPFGSSGSSFSNENNILKVSYSEIEDKNQCSIMEARKTLRVNASEISKELGAAAVTAKQSVTTKKVMDVACDTVYAASALESTETQAPIDLKKVTDRALLRRLADIYAILIDLNFTTNVLNEVSFLLNLLNANDVQQIATATVTEQIQALQLSEDTSNKLLETSGFPAALRNFTNCIYFACRVLEQQRQLLALLDLKSLGVVLNNERIAYLADDVKSFLNVVYQQKQQVVAHKSLQDTSIRFDTSFKNVYYQEDKDSRQHFSSNNEFSAFKTQRDLFCRTLKLWQANHLNSAWSFANEITPKIREIFKQSEHPVNMAHFAKLFVSQLLISSSDATSPEEIGIEMDLQKFSKLTQRLVAPSNFSVDYQFPRNQAFFRDFVSEARCLSFAEQLKIALYSELITLNDSSFEQLQLATTPDKEDDEEETVSYSHGYKEFTVHPEVLASMLILAKFLGYVTAQPFSEQLGASMAVNVEKKQIMLRNLFQPNFNICSLLEKAIKNGKLLITLPWLVQFLVMLDNVTLQLDTFAKAMQLIFALYMNLGIGRNTQQMPTSVFIVRCCLGWLFETKPIIAEQYYAYRAVHTLCSSAPQRNDDQEIRVRISNDLASELPTSGTPLHISSVKRSVHDGTYTCVLQSPSVLTRVIATPVARPTNFSNALQLNPILESVLNVACPFLADFRVSIMPAKYAMAKYVSRTGRYRHITTRLDELPIPIRSDTETNNLTANSFISQNSQQKSQTKLVEAFLHSQNSSMRRLIEFVIERTYKSVVKDAQYSILLPSKSAADSKVNGITSCNAAVVLRSVASIYNTAREEARQQWDANVSKMIHERVEKALDALLPAETASIIRQTYCNIIAHNTAHKVHQWRYANMIKNNFYCSDLDEVTQKICKANKKERQAAAVSSELRIVNATPSVSDLIDELQYWLHCTSMRPDLLSNVTPIIEFLQRLPLAFENTMPTICYRLIGTGVVQLLQHIVARHPLYMTPNLLDAACSVWLTPEMQNAISHSRPIERDEDSAPPAAGDDESGNSLAPAEVPSIYGGLITISFIESLGTQRICFDKLGEFLIEIINQCVTTADFVNMLFVPIFKVDWHPNVLNEISNMLQTIVKQTGGGFGQDDGVKSRLFMEVLADMSRNVDVDF